MSAGTLSLRCIVLSRQQGAGAFERLSLLDAEEGLVSAMRRLSAKEKGAVPDLFDLASVQLSSGKSGGYFVSEYVPERRFGGIGRCYGALASASTWAGLLLANAPSMDEAAGLFDLSLKALDAWDSCPLPNLVLLKALYSFARLEGLPAKEEWLAAMPAQERALVEGLISKPLAEHGLHERADAEGAIHCAAITTWMCGHHIIPPKSAAR